MALLPREAHALRQIERDLAEADPRLAAYLAGNTGHRISMWMAYGVYLVVPVLVVAGLLAHVLAVTISGIVLAPAAPLIVFRLLRGNWPRLPMHGRR